MAGIDEVVRAWSSAGTPTTTDRLGRYARALVAEGHVGPYRPLDDDQEDRAILTLYRVDRPHATMADLHQNPPLALSCYRQMLRDLAMKGLGPLGPVHQAIVSG